MTKIVRATKHTLRFVNKEKRKANSDFIDEYRRAAQLYINYIWDNRTEIVADSGKVYIIDIQNNKLDMPKYLDYNIVKFKTTLSARALSSCITQVVGMLKSATKQQSKRLYVISKLLSEGKVPSKYLINKVRNYRPVRPSAANLLPELSSKCFDLRYTENSFDAFVRLKSIGKAFGHLKFPIKFYSRANDWKATGKQLGSILVSKDCIDIRWEITKPPKLTGTTVGADQGYKDILTLSDGQVTPKTDIHNHSLESIIAKLARKQKGSEAFTRAQEHRKNFINYSINQINLSPIGQINLEEIININHKRNTSRKMSHWMNTLIRDKLIRRCEEQEVLVKLQPSAYRSQRCNRCGLVRKANRKGKQYTCKGCGATIDSDLNAAKNHEQDLYYLSWAERNYIKNNKLNYGKGFYWQTNGIFDTNGGELYRVPLSQNKGSNV